MITTEILKQEQEPIIASSFLKQITYPKLEEEFLETTSSCLMPDNFLFYDIDSLSKIIHEKFYQDKYDMFKGTEINEMEHPKKHPKTNSVEKIIEALFSFDTIKRIFLHEKKDDKTISIWVVSDVKGMKTKRSYCHLFAEIVDQVFDTDYQFYFRILGPNSNELQLIPSEAYEYEGD